MNNILNIAHLSKQYQSRQVVKDVSLTLQTGEIVGLLGPNGAGKTTSFYMIVGLIPADEGSIKLNEIELISLPVEQRARYGLSYLPQETSIFRKLTVEENILALLELRKDLTRDKRKQILESLLDEFRINHIKNTLGINLSGGERRRVEIARALTMDPKFILLDEPFAGIDPISIIDVKRIMQQLVQKGIGILITDHNVRDTLMICQRAYIVNQGKVIAEGTPLDIATHPEVKEVYLGEDFNLT